MQSATERHHILRARTNGTKWKNKSDNQEFGSKKVVMAGLRKSRLIEKKLNLCSNYNLQRIEKYHALR